MNGRENVNRRNLRISGKTQFSPLLKNRKLRVGYLSADFANHPVGRFLLPILSNHDKEVVELWALSTGSHQDWITDHLRERVDHWIDSTIFNRLPNVSKALVADLES